VVTGLATALSVLALLFWALHIIFHLLYESQAIPFVEEGTGSCVVLDFHH